jgi:HAE1 family hydrophobic/amphiphilic exporter-1
MPAGSTLATTNEAVQRLEKEIASYPETDAILSLVGIGGQLGGGQARSAQLFVSLKPLSQRSKSVYQIADQVREAGRAIPGMTVRVAPASFVGTGGQAIQISVKGSDIEVLSQIASQVEEIARNTPGTLDVTNSAGHGAPEMRVQLDQERLSDLGLTSAQVAGALRTAFEGTVATELRRENEDKVDIRVKYGSVGNQSDLASIPDVPLTTPRGTVVKLSQVAKLVPVEGPAEIERENRTRQVAVTSAVNGRPLGDVTADLKQGINALQVPAGYEVVMRGEAEMQDESFNSIGSALLISIVLMYMLMVALYNSLVYPLVIMGALPVASVGAIGALALFGDTLNIFSLIGFIMLTGLVAKNAILVVDYTNTLRDRGYSRQEALLEAGPTRLRPIVMTTAAMVFAMLPMAVKFGEGAATRSPMAIVVIGGLITSTLLTLVVVPAGYTVMDDFQQWVAARFGRKNDPVEAEALPETPERHDFGLSKLAKPGRPVQVKTVGVRAE